MGRSARIPEFTGRIVNASRTVNASLYIDHAVHHRDHQPFEHLFYRTFVLSVAQMFE